MHGERKFLLNCWYEFPGVSESVFFIHNSLYASYSYAYEILTLGLRIIMEYAKIEVRFTTDCYV